MLTPKTLNAAQDSVFADKTLWPKDDAADHITFCNLAAITVARDVGCSALDSTQGREPLMADELYQLFKARVDLFAPLMLPDCQERVNTGALVFAVLPGWRLQECHGHICTLTTGVGDHSGRWNAFTPLCMNLGRTGTCFRNKGVNWAFQIVPEFFVWTPH